MRQILILVFSAFILMGCAESDKNTDKLVITVYESYNLTEIYQFILNANTFIRKKQLDSISKSPSGLVLLDKMNEEESRSDTLLRNSIDDYPLFQVLSPNIKMLGNGSGTLDTSSIIGLASDTVKLLQYLNQTHALFPNDLDWRIGGGRSVQSKVKCVHAFKRHNVKTVISDSEVDSVIVLLTGVSALGVVARKIGDLKGMSYYWIKIKLKQELSNKLANRSYSLIMNLESHEYSGSVVNFRSNPNQYIDIGEMDYKDYQVLKSKFRKRFKTY